MKRQMYIYIIFWICILCLNTIGQNSGFKKCDVLYPIKEESGNGGYINCKGDVVVKPQFLGVREFNNGVGIIHTGEGDGFVDSKGKITIFKGVEFFDSKFSEGLAFGKFKEILGFIDKRGKVVIKIPRYKETLGFSEGFGAIPINEKYYFIDKQGNVAIDKGFDGIEGVGFVEGMATVGINGKYAVINRSGEYIIKPQDEYISYPSDRLVNIYCENEKAWIYVNKNGEVVLRVHYDYAGNFSNNLAEVKVNGKWGFIDTAGKIVINPKFEQVQEFSENLAAVSLNGKLGFINKKGEFVIPPIFEYKPFEISFKHGLVYVSKESIEGYIDKSGQWVWKTQKY